MSTINKQVVRAFRSRFLKRAAVAGALIGVGEGEAEKVRDNMPAIAAAQLAKGFPVGAAVAASTGLPVGAAVAASTGLSVEPIVNTPAAPAIERDFTLPKRPLSWEEQRECIRRLSTLPRRGGVVTGGASSGGSASLDLFENNPLHAGAQKFLERNPHCLAGPRSAIYVPEKPGLVIPERAALVGPSGKPLSGPSLYTPEPKPRIILPGESIQPPSVPTSAGGRSVFGPSKPVNGILVPESAAGYSTVPEAAVAPAAEIGQAEAAGAGAAGKAVRVPSGKGVGAVLRGGARMGARIGTPMAAIASVEAGGYVGGTVGDAIVTEAYHTPNAPWEQWQAIHDTAEGFNPAPVSTLERKRFHDQVTEDATARALLAGSLIGGGADIAQGALYGLGRAVADPIYQYAGLESPPPVGEFFPTAARVGQSFKDDFTWLKDKTMQGGRYMSQLATDPVTQQDAAVAASLGAAAIVPNIGHSIYYGLPGLGQNAVQALTNIGRGIYNELRPAGMQPVNYLRYSPMNYGDIGQIYRDMPPIDPNLPEERLEEAKANRLCAAYEMSKRNPHNVMRNTTNTLQVLHDTYAPVFQENMQRGEVSEELAPVVSTVYNKATYPLRWLGANVTTGAQGIANWWNGEKPKGTYQQRFNENMRKSEASPEAGAYALKMYNDMTALPRGTAAGIATGAQAVRNGWSGEELEVKDPTLGQTPSERLDGHVREVMKPIENSLVFAKTVGIDGGVVDYMVHHPEEFVDADTADMVRDALPYIDDPRMREYVHSLGVSGHIADAYRGEPGKRVRKAVSNGWINLIENGASIPTPAEVTGYISRAQDNPFLVPLLHPEDGEPTVSSIWNTYQQFGVLPSPAETIPQLQRQDENVPAQGNPIWPSYSLSDLTQPAMHTPTENTGR